MGYLGFVVVPFLVRISHGLDLRFLLALGRGLVKVGLDREICSS